MRPWLLSALLLGGCAQTGEVWLVTHDPAAGERTGDCALSARTSEWSEIAEVYVDGAEAVVVLPSAALTLAGSATGDLLDVRYEVAESGQDITFERLHRYQLDLGAGTGTALTTRTEIRAGTTVEDCVDTVPVALDRLD